MMSLSQTTTRWFRSSIGMRVVALCLLLFTACTLHIRTRQRGAAAANAAAASAKA